MIIFRTRQYTIWFIDRRMKKNSLPRRLLILHLPINGTNIKRNAIVRAWKNASRIANTIKIQKNPSAGIKDILPKDFVAAVKPVTLIHGKADVRKEAENHMLDLYDLSRSNDFAKQLQLVESLENWLKTCFPNKMFCSYFLYSKTMTSKFCFHMEYPNMDWISDRKVKSSNDCIRKNTFWYFTGVKSERSVYSMQ